MPADKEGLKFRFLIVQGTILSRLGRRCMPRARSLRVLGLGCLGLVLGYPSLPACRCHSWKSTGWQVSSCSPRHIFNQVVFPISNHHSTAASANFASIEHLGQTSSAKTLLHSNSAKPWLHKGELRHPSPSHQYVLKLLPLKHVKSFQKLSNFLHLMQVEQVGHKVPDSSTVLWSGPFK